jgi:hypothetical protein
MISRIKKSNIINDKIIFNILIQIQQIDKKL